MKLPTLNVLRLFRHTTKKEWFLLALGSVSATLHAMVLPLALLLLSMISDNFFNYEAMYTFSNGLIRVPLPDVRKFLTSTDGVPEGSPIFRITDQHILLYKRTNTTQILFDLANLTGGVIDCNAMYALDILSTTYTATLGEIVRARFGDRYSCVSAAILQHNINVLIFPFLAVLILALVLGSLQVLFFQLASERQVRRIKLLYYQSVLRQDMQWFDSHPPGEICAHLSENTEKIYTGIGPNMGAFFQWIMTFISAICVGFYLQWKLTCVLLGIAPFITAPSIIFNKISSIFSEKEQEHYSSAASVAEEVLSAIQTVVAFGGEYKESARYDKMLEKTKRLQWKKGIAGGLSLFATMFMLFASFGFATWYSAHLVEFEGVAFSDLIGVLFAVIIGAFFLGNSTSNLSLLLDAAKAAVPVFQVIDREPKVMCNPKEGLTPSDLEATVEFKDVDFSYEGNGTAKVLKGINLKVEAGQTLALVGPSGSGKSTILSLIMHLYETSSGEIRIGGKDIHSLNIDWLRTQIGLVRQEPVLFNTSIAENIRLGKLDASMEEIIAAAKMANAHGFIKKLPQQYNTMVGEHGDQLSGGQKQRIAIARALVRNPKFLLLDEATSALDSESEAVVQAALDTVKTGRTTIVIAHRLSALRNADIIATVCDGRITKVGSYSEMIRDATLQKEVLAEEAIKETITKNTVPTRGASLRRQTMSLRRVTLGRHFHMHEDERISKPSLLKMLRFNSRDWILIILGCVGALISGIIFPLWSVMYRQSTEALKELNPLEESHPWAASFIALGVAAGFGNFVRHLCFTVSGDNFTNKIRSLTFKSILRQEMGWFDKEQNSTANLSSLLADDARNLQYTGGTRLGIIIEIGAAFLTAHILAFQANWILTLLLVGVLPVFILVLWLQTRVSMWATTVRRNAFLEANEVALDGVENIDTVTSFGLEERLYKDYKKHLKKPDRSALAMTPLYPLTQLSLFGGYIIAIRFGAYQIIQDRNSIAFSSFEDVLETLGALLFAGFSIALSQAFTSNYAKSELSGRKIFTILERRPRPDGYSEDGNKLDNVVGDIVLKNVSFNYPLRTEAKVLQHLSLNVPSGKTLALVGASGCGKSTIMSLIERFYDPSYGAITLDGRDLRGYNIRWLRSQIGLVSQEPVLFDATIANNIRYGLNSREVTDEEVFEAAKAANIDTFVKSLPQGYESRAGGKGANLSGGQKQRIAIARALIRDPKILLLDEATSALDSESEKIVQEALDCARKGRTAIVIAHRLSTVYSADIIAVMKGGAIVEQGSHSELMAIKGTYYKMNCLQNPEMIGEKNNHSN